MKQYYVYILTNQSRTLYVGMTNDIASRLAQHLDGVGSTFTRKYRLTQLVHVEMFGRVQDAIAREKEIKGWRREKKIALMESMNPRWEALSPF